MMVRAFEMACEANIADVFTASQYRQRTSSSGKWRHTGPARTPQSARRIGIDVQAMVIVTRIMHPTGQTSITATANA
jgi:hypothetical protein